MIYLDNAATTFKKPKSVFHAVKTGITKYSANPGRSSHPLSLASAEEVYMTRDAVCRFLGTDSPERVVFTLNATYAINMALTGLITEKCHVLISDLEHNSVIRPLEKLKKNIGISYTAFNTNAENLEEEIKSHITTDTKFIVSTLASNVTGKEIPLNILSKTAKENNLKLIADASQLIGHKKIDLNNNPCSALCAPAHKALFGIEGLGFVIFGKDEIIEPFVEGGSGTDSLAIEMPQRLPERMEAGTLPVPAIMSLRAGIEFIERITLPQIESKINKLSELAFEKILSIPNIVVYGANMGVIAFNAVGCDSERMALILAEEGICVRGGLHCSPLAHKTLNTVKSGAIRVSLSYFSTEYDIYRLFKALKKISNKSCGFKNTDILF